jgi:hypothetical protein
VRSVPSHDWASKILHRRRAPGPALPFNLDAASSPRWDERAEAATALLAGNAESLLWDRSIGLSIADFGAGNERLNRALASRLGLPYTYAGFDIQPQSEAVVELDVTRELPREDYDVVFCLGLLEYLAQLGPFLSRLSSRYPAAVMSYTVFDAPHRLGKRQRRKRGWLTHYTADRLEREFETRGFMRRDFCLTNQERTGIWLLVPPSSSAAASSRRSTAKS